MASIHFYLREYKSKSGKSQLYFSYSHDSKKWRCFTGIKIFPKHWNPDKQQVLPHHESASEINALIKSKRAEIEGITNEAAFKRIDPTVEFVKLTYKGITEPPKSFSDLYSQFIKDQRNQVSAARIKRYRTTYNHLQNFELFRKKRINELEDIDMKFFIDFENYLVDKKRLSWNTVAQQKTVLKTFMAYAQKLNLHNNADYQHVKAGEKKTEIIALSSEELNAIKQLELTETRLINARDLFLFQTYTGQRYGDVKNLRKEDIKGNYWHLHVAKSEERNKIPLTLGAKEILKKYGNSLRTISNQKMNEYLKELGELAGIDEPVNKFKWVGTKKINNYVPKWKVLTTHVARKTFITESLIRDLDVSFVKEISGHKSYAVFDQYKKFTDKFKHEKLNQAWSD